MSLRTRFRCGLALLTLAALSTPARAEVVVGNSLEWLTCASELVVVGRAESVRTSRGPGEVRYDDCTVLVEEVVRGKADGKRVVFCYRSLGDDKSAAAWMRSKEPVLLFLSVSRDHGPEKRLDGMLVPTTEQVPLSVIDLAAPNKYAIDRHFNVVGDKTAILKTCRDAAAQLARHPDKGAAGKLRAVQLRVPPDSPAHGSLYAGSACFLKAPEFMAPANKAKE